MTSAEFMISFVDKYGWFAVGNIFADNGYIINPFTVNGCVCASNSAEQLFTTGKYDIENTAVLENKYLVAPIDRVGFQQTIVAIQFSSIQHFDAHLLSQGWFYDLDGDDPKFVLPKWPTDVESMVANEETGLYPGTDTITRLDGNDISAIDVFEDLPLDHYTGIRVKPYQNFIRNQKLFAEAMNTYFGLSDCK